MADAVNYEAVPTIVNLGVDYHESGDVTSALQMYEAAIEIAPLNPIPRFNRGVALEDLGRIAEATEEYKAALRLDPTSGDVAFNLARLGNKEVC